MGLNDKSLDVLGLNHKIAWYIGSATQSLDMAASRYFKSRETGEREVGEGDMTTITSNTTKQIKLIYMYMY